MEKHLTAYEAWDDFWKWLREPEQSGLWESLSRERKQYLYKADINRRNGALGYTRIKNILSEHAPDRYTAVEGFILKEDG